MAAYTPQRQRETAVLEEGQKINLKWHYICKVTVFQMCLKPKTNQPKSTTTTTKKRSFKNQTLDLKGIKYQNSAFFMLT